MENHEVVVKEGEQVTPRKALFKIIQNNKGFTYIFSRDTGIIERIHVKNGEQFKRNQLLIEISLKDSRKDYDSLDNSENKQNALELESSHSKDEDE